MIAVLIFGSRDLPHLAPVWTVLNGIAARRALEEAESVLVIEGGCPTGADLYANQWAESSPWPNIRHEQYPPDRRRTDNRRFFERNVRMTRRLAELADQGASIEAWGFVSKPLESSRGSKLMAGILADNGLPYQLVRVVPASSQPQVAGVPDGPTKPGTIHRPSPETLRSAVWSPSPSDPQSLASVACCWPTIVVHLGGAFGPTGDCSIRDGGATALVRAHSAAGHGTPRVAARGTGCASRPHTTTRRADPQCRPTPSLTVSLPWPCGGSGPTPPSGISAKLAATPIGSRRSSTPAPTVARARRDRRRRR